MGLSNKKYFVGDNIGYYKIIAETDKRSNDGHKIYKVRCEICNIEFESQLYSLYRSRNLNSCSHIRKHSNTYKFLGKSRRGANKERTALSHILNDMIRRCYNLSDKNYRFYGLKGIKICKEWFDIDLFYDWAIGNGYKLGLTIDRIDSTKDYCPENCRWITREENAKWKSTTRAITVNGITDSGRGWAKRLKIGTNRINKMIRKNGIESTIEFIQSNM